MSGPIIRKYGFPNFEKIFGEREIKHGVEDEAPTPPAPAQQPEVKPESPGPKPAPPKPE